MTRNQGEQEGFDGYLAGESIRQTLKRLAINPHSESQEAERNAVIRGHYDAEEMDRATRPQRSRS